MGDVKVKFDDDNHTNNQISEAYFMLNPTCGTIFQLPTLSDEMESRLITKRELASIIIVADTLFSKGKLFSYH
jgi:hypothetical protein